MSTIDNYLINGDYPDEWPEDACDLVDILREHETRYIVRVAVLEAKLEAMGEELVQLRRFYVDATNLDPHLTEGSIEDLLGLTSAQEEQEG